MNTNAGNYYTAAGYWQLTMPDAYSSLFNTEQVMKEDTALAQKVAAELGEAPRILPGENLPAYNYCVWAMLYERYR